ncbi:YjfA family protein [Streptomyces sp. STR69]|uniref:YjfA family protein n=1 Tax=Streptomyces sp. STR69 TaxID=1796942 RepID=UPI0021C9FA53|nr:YjfA family protein [Streptomyces sp. STR69]
MESHVTVERQRLLTERLRLLKQRTGLSLAALAALTPYSKSTWHRYLNGDQFPPRAVVEALARLAHTDPGPLLSLWDAAVLEQSRPTAPPPQPPAPPVRPRRLRAPARALVALAAMATTVAVTAGAADVLDRDTGAEPYAAASCRDGGCQGESPSVGTCARDARTERVVARAAQVVRLRYSPSCATVWSEVRTRVGGAREISIRSGRDELSAEYPGDRSDGYSSPMLAAADPRGAQACAEVGGRPVCTAPDH